MWMVVRIVIRKDVKKKEKRDILMNHNLFMYLLFP